MDAYLGLLVQLCCGEGGTLQTNITGVCGECLQHFSHTGFVPAHGVCAFPVYPVQALGCSARNCLRCTLGCMHFPVLNHSGSGSQILHKVQTWLGLRFVPFPGPSSSGDEVLGEHTPQVCSASYRLPGPSRLVSWEHSGSTVPHVPCVSSGELISGCDPTVGCQQSRFPGTFG